jgi:hypothetical protein
MSAFWHLQTGMAFSDRLVVLGKLWTACDNIGVHRSDLVELLQEELENPLTTIPQLMSRKEKAAFDALPEQATIYRGCGHRNRDGLSWSISREIAMRFPFMRRYETDHPILLTATVSKHRIAALKLDRNEEEAIVIDLPASYWSEEPITEPPPSVSPGDA